MIPLVNKECIEKWLTAEETFHTSHHATTDFLGGGMLYYALAYLLKSRCSVCLGSGSGFVPRIMRQAQFDLGITDQSETILIDADLPEAGWGAPDYHNGDKFFNKNFDVKIIRKTTRDALEDMREKRFGYLHIDADHSYGWVSHDFYAYSKLMLPHGIITLHDSMVQTGVPVFLEELKNNPKYEICNIQIGTGVAIVREKP